MKIGIANDHAGFELKQYLLNHLSSSYEFVDLGCYSIESVDYPDYAHKLCKDLINNNIDKGVLICGSGNGINITANKYKEIRSALCWNAEIAELSRKHNDANVLTLPGRYISQAEALKCVKVFMSTEFEGGRHLTRVNKISC